MIRLTTTLALCVSGLLLSSCARPIVPAIDVGDYYQAPRDVSQKQTKAVPPGELTCDEAVSRALAMPVLTLLKRAETVLSSARGANSMLGQAELRLRNNLSKTEEFRTTLRWRPSQYGLTGIRIQEENASQRAAKAMDSIRRAMATAEVRQLHLDFRMAQLALRESKVELEALRARARLAVAALASGTITRAESERINTELKLVMMSYENTRHSVHLAKARFTALVGAPPQPSQCSTKETERSLAEHPEVIVAIEDANLSTLRADVRSGEAGLWPSFVETSWQRNDGGATDQFLVELGVPLLTDRSRRAAVARGQAKVAVGEARWVAQSVATRVRLAKALLKSRLAQLESAQSSLKTPGPDATIGSPAEQARVTRLRARLLLNVQKLEHAVEAAKISLQAVLSVP
jgi:hypothetical protein